MVQLQLRRPPCSSPHRHCLPSVPHLECCLMMGHDKVSVCTHFGGLAFLWLCGLVTHWWWNLGLMMQDSKGFRFEWWVDLTLDLDLIKCYQTSTLPWLEADSVPCCQNVNHLPMTLSSRREMPVNSIQNNRQTGSNKFHTMLVFFCAKIKSVIPQHTPCVITLCWHILRVL